MKVLLVIEGIWPPVVETCGIKSVYDLQTFLSQFGIEIHIVTTLERWADSRCWRWYKEESNKNKITFHILDLGWLKRFPKLNFYSSKLLLFFKVFFLNLRYKFDIIHEYSSAPLLINRTALYKLFFNVKTVHTICTYVSLNALNYIFLNKVDKIILTNRDMEKQIPIKCQDKIRFIPIGINIKEATKDQGGKEYDYLKSKEDIINILYVGPLEERKGARLLMEAIPRILNISPNVRFIIATHAINNAYYDYEKKKQAFLDKVKNVKDNIKLLEGKQNIFALLNRADAVVLPYENLGGTLGIPSILIESLVFGKIVIISDLPPLKNIIVNRYNGLLFAKNDISDLSNKINDFLSLDNMFLEKIRKNAIETGKRFNNRNLAMDIKQLYESLLVSK
jgi:glycosyltransferase involved in cell wall biosynthesis